MQITLQLPSCASSQGNLSSVENFISALREERAGSLDDYGQLCLGSDEFSIWFVYTVVAYAYECVNTKHSRNPSVYQMDFSFYSTWVLI